MKVHWRTAERWCREFCEGASFREIAFTDDRAEYELEPNGSLTRRPEFYAVRFVEDAVRQAILRREKRRNRGK